MLCIDTLRYDFELYLRNEFLDHFEGAYAFKYNNEIFWRFLNEGKDVPLLNEDNTLLYKCRSIEPILILLLEDITNKKFRK